MVLFSFPNWIQRLAANPGYLSNYMRVRNAIHEANLRIYRNTVGDPQVTELPLVMTSPDASTWAGIIKKCTWNA